MSFFNFCKKTSKTDDGQKHDLLSSPDVATPAGIPLSPCRQLVLFGFGRLRIVAASDWFLTRADDSIPDAEDRKCYRQQGDTLYIGTDIGIGTNGGSVIGGNNITSINNSVIGSIVQTAGSTVIRTGDGTVMTGNSGVQTAEMPPFDFVLHGPRLPHIAASDRVVIEAEGAGFAEQSVDCRLSGEASFVCHDVDAPLVELELTGNSLVEISGVAKALQLEVTGSGEMDFSACRAESATVDVTGSGRIEVNVSDTLEGSITGSGTVIHVGEPRHKRIEVHGSGRVRHR